MLFSTNLLSNTKSNTTNQEPEKNKKTMSGCSRELEMEWGLVSKKEVNK